MSIKITAKTLGLVVGASAIAAAAVLAVSYNSAGTNDTVNVAKNAVNATGETSYSAPTANVRSGGSDSGVTTTANPGG